MFRLSSIVLLLVGLAAVVVGVSGALWSLAELYQGALEAPLEQSEDAEAAAARNMLISVGIGAGGLAPLLLGTFFWKRDRIRARRRARGG